MADGQWVPLRVAWQEALYGAEGFYQQHLPGAHFRTSSHVSTSFAVAVVELARRQTLVSVCDIGAGNGELLVQIERLAPRLALTGVDIRGRPAGLPETITWQEELPSGWDGLVFANELLDNIPCDVVELDAHGTCRVVEVRVSSGVERLGAEATLEQLHWLSTWWPLTRPGQRAEVGLARDALWTRLRADNPRALCVAVDYGHQANDRPAGGSLSSYRGGVQTPVSFDGRHDITAHVAFDSLAAASVGLVRRQRDVLHDLGINGQRPPLSLATEDPARYVQDLSRATERAELTAVEGLGDLYWVSTPPRDTSRVSSDRPAAPGDQRRRPSGRWPRDGR